MRSIDKTLTFHGTCYFWKWEGLNDIAEILPNRRTGTAKQLNYVLMMQAATCFSAVLRPDKEG